MIKLTCGDEVRYVRNIKICSGLNATKTGGAIGCSLVNDGHDDLIDLGLWDALQKHQLVIAPDDRHTSVAAPTPIETIGGTPLMELIKLSDDELNSYLSRFNNGGLFTPAELETFRLMARSGRNICSVGLVESTIKDLLKIAMKGRA